MLEEILLMLQNDEAEAERLLDFLLSKKSDSDLEINNLTTGETSC